MLCFCFLSQETQKKGSGANFTKAPEKPPPHPTKALMKAAQKPPQPKPAAKKTKALNAEKRPARVAGKAGGTAQEEKTMKRKVFQAKVESSGGNMGSHLSARAAAGCGEENNKSDNESVGNDAVGDISYIRNCTKKKEEEKVRHNFFFVQH